MGVLYLLHFEGPVEGGGVGYVAEFLELFNRRGERYAYPFRTLITASTHLSGTQEFFVS